MSRIVRISIARTAQEAEGADTIEVQEHNIPVGNDFDNNQASQDYDVEGLESSEYNYPKRAISNRSHVLVISGATILLIAIFSMVLFLVNIRTMQQGVQDVGGTEVSGSTSGLETAPRVGALAPDFSLVNVDTDQAVTLASLRGKPVLINFWGTWCPPCRAEMPEMQRLFAKYAGQMEMIGISMGPRDVPEQVKSFVDKYKYPWTFIHDPDYSVANGYQVSAIPTSYFLDKNGVIRAAHIGAMTLDVMEKDFLLSR